MVTKTHQYSAATSVAVKMAFEINYDYYLLFSFLIPPPRLLCLLLRMAMTCDILLEFGVNLWGPLFS